MFLKTVFLFIFLFGVQGHTETTSRFECSYNSPQTFATYTFNLQLPNISEKAEIITNKLFREMAMTWDNINHYKTLNHDDSLTNYGDPAIILSRLEKIKALDEINRNRTMDTRCVYQTDNKRLSELLKTNCSLDDKVIKICEKVKKKALKIVCGKRSPQNHCEGGQYGLATALINQLTTINRPPTLKEIRHFTETRNNIARTIVRLQRGLIQPATRTFDYGYKHCMKRMRGFLDQRDEKGRHPCFDIYDIYFEKQMGEMMKYCEPEAVVEYVEFDFQPKIAHLQRRQDTFIKGYTKVKNDYAMARVCTLKLMKALNGMDVTLDKMFPPQRQAAATPND